MRPFIIDAHQDLAYNMLSYGRDYTKSVADTRLLEIGSKAVKENGNTLLSWDEFQKANVRVIFSTLFAAPAINPMHQDDPMLYHNSDEAHLLYLKQIEAYKSLVAQHPNKFNFILRQDDLTTALNPDRTNSQVSLMILMEGADCIRKPEEASFWWEQGVRVIGPAWKATRYCGGTGQPGPLTPDGHKLLAEMAKLGFILDLSHMDWAAALQALEEYPGTIIASHANVASKTEGGVRNRFLTDEIIKKLVGRGGVIGVIPFNNFLLPGWNKMDPIPRISLEMVADHIDAICQIAGNADHVGFGTDFDGGFGVESTPEEIDTIDDLHKMHPILAKRGYKESDISKIFGENWANILARSLPA